MWALHERRTSVARASHGSRMGVARSCSESWVGIGHGPYRERWGGRLAGLSCLLGGAARSDEICLKSQPARENKKAGPIRASSLEPIAPLLPPLQCWARTDWRTGRTAEPILKHGCSHRRSVLRAHGKRVQKKSFFMIKKTFFMIKQNLFRKIGPECKTFCTLGVGCGLKKKGF